MLVESWYPEDTRVRNEAVLLASAGYQVSVISLKKPGQKWRETLDGVRVYRVPRLEWFKKTADGEPTHVGLVLLKLKSFLGYCLEYIYFTSVSLLVSLVLFVTKGFDVIHAHNPPDTLFLVALPFKLLGRKFIFDHHDLSPELYLSRYRAKPGMLTRLLRLAEWCSLRLADITIATNESYKRVQIERGGRDPNSIVIVRNGPNPARMRPPAPNSKLRAMNKCILCYVGKQAAELQLNGAVDLTGFVSEEELEANLAAADICVDPDPSSPLNDVSTWIKIMEYMAYSKPIVTFDLKETRFSAQEGALFVPANDEHAFARAIVELMDNPLLRKKIGAAGRKRVEEKLQWSVVSENLLAAYRKLLKT